MYYAQYIVSQIDLSKSLGFENFLKFVFKKFKLNVFVDFKSLNSKQAASKALFFRTQMYLILISKKIFKFFKELSEKESNLYKAFQSKQNRL